MSSKLHKLMRTIITLNRIRNTRNYHSAKNNRKQSGFHLWSRTISAWAQVFTLAVLVFGYFYTVRPTFQKERLAEKVSQLQLQEANITHELDTSKNELANLRQEYDNERKKLYLEKQELEKTKKELSKSERELDTTLSSLNRAKKNNSIANARLRKSESIYFYTLIAQTLIPASSKGLFISFNMDPQKIFYSKTKMRQIKSDWPSPYKIILDAINRAEKRVRSEGLENDVMFKKVHNYIINHRHDLQCAIPDLNKMSIEYKKKIAAVDKSAKNELPKYLNKIRKEDNPNNDANIRTEITPEFKSESLRILEVGNESAIESEYQNKISESLRSCLNKPWDVYTKMGTDLGIKKSENKTPDPSTREAAGSTRSW